MSTPARKSRGVLVAVKPKIKNPDFHIGFFKIGGVLYSVEPSKSNKDGVTLWLSIKRRGTAPARSTSRRSSGSSRDGYTPRRKSTGRS